MLQEHQGCLKATCDLETQQESLDEYNHVRRVAERLKPQHGKEEEEHLAVRGQCSQPSPDQTLQCCDQVLPCQLHIRTQPMDQGIIKKLKTGCRKRLLSRVIAKIDSCETGDELVKSVNVLDAIYWVAQAWQDVRQKLFRSATLVVGSNSSRDSSLSRHQSQQIN